MHFLDGMSKTGPPRKAAATIHIPGSRAGQTENSCKGGSSSSTSKAPRSNGATLSADKLVGRMGLYSNISADRYTPVKAAALATRKKAGYPSGNSLGTNSSSRGKMRSAGGAGAGGGRAGMMPLAAAQPQPGGRVGGALSNPAAGGYHGSSFPRGVTLRDLSESPSSTQFESPYAASFLPAEHMLEGEEHSQSMLDVALLTK